MTTHAVSAPRTRDKPQTTHGTRTSGHRIAALGCWATCLAVVATATPARAAVTMETVFNIPTGSVTQQHAIDNRVIELIQGAPSGSTIQVSMYYMATDAIPDALVAAHKRGANVQVLMDGKVWTETPPTQIAQYVKLEVELGTEPSRSSYVQFCPIGRGCIGGRALNGVSSINHNKFFLLSRTGTRQNVVVQSSANLRYGRDGTLAWNNAVIISGNDGLYNEYRSYFADLKNMRVNNNYYDSRRPAVYGRAQSHFFPRAETAGASPYSDPSEDPIMTILNQVSCYGSTSVGVGDGTHRTIVRVAMSILSRKYLAKKLAALDNAGCYVDVVITLDPTDCGQVAAVKELGSEPAAVYNGVPVVYYEVDDAVRVHSKYLAIEGKYEGVPDRKLVWTGSHNWSTNSLRQSDEALLRIEDAAVHDSFRSNFWKVRNAALHTHLKGDVLDCENP